jgi:hypothetical protein
MLVLVGLEVVALSHAVQCVDKLLPLPLPLLRVMIRVMLLLLRVMLMLMVVVMQSKDVPSVIAKDDSNNDNPHLLPQLLVLGNAA